MYFLSTNAMDFIYLFAYAMPKSTQYQIMKQAKEEVAAKLMQVLFALSVLPHYKSYLWS